ncbi:MAG: hypothetical protein GEU78_09590 [Actinobacteria bacterium]|nr:hypothetical protein [Actinomycetota bacterium]
MVRRMLFGPEPEPTLHPTISHEVIEHLQVWGYLVTAEKGLGAAIEAIVETNRHKTSAAISLLIMRRIRRGNG